jgi:GIY-YIG catalytic domain
MQIQASWSQPSSLTKCKPGGLIYELELEQLPTQPGVYVFGRKHGNKIVPIYVGETVSIRGRIKSHLESLPLMRAIENAANGGRFLIYCTVGAGTETKAKKHVKIIEKALILHAQSEGHVLFNKKGTKLPTDEITFVGNRTSESIAPRSMLIKRALTKTKSKPKSGV